jgi:hypothetical protein
MAKITYSEKVVLPKNTYRFQVRACNLRKNQITQDEFFGWDWEVISAGPHYGEPVSYAMSQKITPGSNGLAFLMACGMPRPDKPKVEFDSDSFIGCTFWAAVDTAVGKDINKTLKNIFTTFWSESEFNVIMQQVQQPAPVPQVQQPAPAPQVQQPAPAPQNVSYAGAPVQQFQQNQGITPGTQSPLEVPTDNTLRFPK